MGTEKTFLRFIGQIYFRYFCLLVYSDYCQMLSSNLRFAARRASYDLSKKGRWVWTGMGRKGHQLEATALLSYLRLVNVTSKR